MMTNEQLNEAVVKYRELINKNQQEKNKKEIDRLYNEIVTTLIDKVKSAPTDGIHNNQIAEDAIIEFISPKNNGGKSELQTHIENYDTEKKKVDFFNYIQKKLDFIKKDIIKEEINANLLPDQKDAIGKLKEEIDRLKKGIKNTTNPEELGTLKEEIKKLEEKIKDAKQNRNISLNDNGDDEDDKNYAVEEKIRDEKATLDSLEITETFITALELINEKDNKMIKMLSTERLVWYLQTFPIDYSPYENRAKNIICNEFAKHYIENYCENNTVSENIKKKLKPLKEFDVTGENENKPCGYYPEKKPMNLKNVVFTTYGDIVEKTVSNNRNSFADKIGEIYGIKTPPKKEKNTTKSDMKSMLYAMSMPENNIPEEIAITEDNAEKARLELFRKLIDIELDADGSMQEYVNEYIKAQMFG